MFIRTWSFDDVAVLDVSERVGIEEGRAFRATVSNVLRDGRRQLVVNRLGVSACFTRASNSSEPGRGFFIMIRRGVPRYR